MKNKLSGSLSKPKFSIVALFVFIAIFVLGGIYLLYRLYAASAFDILLYDGDIKMGDWRSVERVDGANYIERSIVISKKMYPSGTTAPAVVIGSTSDAAETAQASILATSLKSPLMTATLNTVDSKTLSEISRVNPAEIYVVGSTASISTNVDTLIKKQFPTKTFRRITGSDNHALAKGVGEELVRRNGGRLNQGTIVVTKSTTPYLGIVGYYSGVNKYPTLYVGDTIPSTVSSFISTYKPTRTIVVGATGTVPDSTMAKLPGATRITGETRFGVSINVHRSARSTASVGTKYIGIVSDDALQSGSLLAPYLVKINGGLLLDEYYYDSSIASYLDALGEPAYNLSRVFVSTTGEKISDSNLMRYSNSIGNNYTSKQIQLQAMIDARKLLCPILEGALVDYGDAKGYQAITYYGSGKIIVSPSHTASLEKIINHEIYHIIDWRDNGRIDWGENMPYSNPDCTP